ncbi:hypothetical protein BOS5A_40017 [Bosea sp. EC-HK365B]|nr:hypothetical protein BOSE21B_40017 [Bosea sp. 21B]VVT62287.1 hypothetical protein BOS5A_40017 [Bosea sp. EC-HK365B]
MSSMKRSCTSSATPKTLTIRDSPAFERSVVSMARRMGSESVMSMTIPPALRVSRKLCGNQIKS